MILDGAPCRVDVVSHLSIEIVVVVLFVGLVLLGFCYRCQCIVPLSSASCSPSLPFCDVFLFV